MAGSNERPLRGLFIPIDLRSFDTSNQTTPWIEFYHFPKRLSRPPTIILASTAHFRTPPPTVTGGYAPKARLKLIIIIALISSSLLQAVGRAIADAVSSVPTLEPTSFERGLAGNMQDLLMVVSQLCMCCYGSKRANSGVSFLRRFCFACFPAADIAEMAFFWWPVRPHNHLQLALRRLHYPPLK